MTHSEFNVLAKMDISAAEYLRIERAYHLFINMSKGDFCDLYSGMCPAEREELLLAAESKEKELQMLRERIAVREGERDAYGHASMSAPVDVRDVYTYVRQMSATKPMLTFQQADVVGLEIEFRRPAVEFNGLRYRGHEVHFSQPEDVDGRSRVLRISGWYQVDNPKR